MQYYLNNFQKKCIVKLHQFAKFSRLTYLTFCLAFREAMLNLPYQNKETEVTRSVILPHPFALHCNQLVVHFKSQPLIYSLVKYHRHLPPKPGLFAHQIRNLFYVSKQWPQSEDHIKKYEK